jgi:uncharacterized protein
VSAQDNIATINGFYEAFGRGDVDTILDRVTDDIDWATDAADADAAPWYGQRKGKDDVLGFFTGTAEASEVREFDVQAIAANDDDEVMAFIRYRFVAKGGDEEAAMNLHHYWRFRDGKVAHCRCSEDTALTAKTLAG